MNIVKIDDETIDITTETTHRRKKSDVINKKKELEEEIDTARTEINEINELLSCYK